MGKVTTVTKGTLALQEMFAQTNLVELIWFRSGASRLDTVFPRRLHLAQPQRKVCNWWQINAISPNVFVPTEWTMYTEALTVEYALQTICLADMPKRTIVDLTALPVAT